jgi:N-acetylmuramoyl-L-alanine amidase
MRVLIDNGHGVDTKGKRSPDGRLLEYKWAREIAQRLETALRSKAVDAQRLVTEECDICLPERVRRVNSVCGQLGAKNVCLVSIHVNAASNNGWCTARGWSEWIYTRADKESKCLAQLLYAEAERRGLQGNRSVPVRKYWMANFYILKHTKCPAVLTENLFQDNREDVDFLLSEEGKQTMVSLHVDAIMKYLAR